MSVFGLVTTNNKETTRKQQPPKNNKKQYPTVWWLKRKLKGSGWDIKDPVAVFHKASKQWVVQIRWSKKLSLVHHRVFTSKAHAECLVAKIVERGNIDTDHWKRLFRSSYS